MAYSMDGFTRGIPEERSLLLHAMIVGESLSALPGVPTLDWTDRAARVLAQIAGAAATGVCFVSTDASGGIERVDMVGACVAERDGTISDDAGTRREAVIRSTLYDAASWGIRLPIANAPDAFPIGRVLAGNPLTGLISAFGASSPDEFLISFAVVSSGEERHEPGPWVMVGISAENSGGSVSPNDLSLLAAGVQSIAARARQSIGAGPLKDSQWISPREQEVLELLLAGSSTREIAQSFGRSWHTIHDHVKALHRKTGASTRGELIARWFGRPRRSTDKDKRVCIDPPAEGTVEPNSRARVASPDQRSVRGGAHWSASAVGH